MLEIFQKDHLNIYNNIFVEVKTVGHVFRYLPTTVHLSLHLAYYYMMLVSLKSKEIIINQKYLITLARAASYLSGKMREADMHCRHVQEFQDIGGISIDLWDLRNLEVKMLDFFQWNVTMMTPYDYLEQFLSVGFTTEMDKVHNKKSLSQMARPELLKLIRRIEAVSLDLISRSCFNCIHSNFRRRELALAHVLKARQLCGLGNTPQIQSFFQGYYKCTNLQPHELEDTFKVFDYLTGIPQEFAPVDLVLREYDREGNELVDIPVEETITPSKQPNPNPKNEKYLISEIEQNKQKEEQYRQQERDQRRLKHIQMTKSTMDGSIERKILIQPPKVPSQRTIVQSQIQSNKKLFSLRSSGTSNPMQQNYQNQGYLIGKGQGNLEINSSMMRSQTNLKTSYNNVTRKARRKESSKVLDDSRVEQHERNSSVLTDRNGGLNRGLMSFSLMGRRETLEHGNHHMENGRGSSRNHLRLSLDPGSRRGVIIAKRR